MQSSNNWGNLVDMITLGLDHLREMEHELMRIKQNLKVAWDKQKNYADRKINHKVFKVGYHVYIKLKPKRSSLRIKTCTKIAPNYCESFEFIERVRPMA
jgi:hypothetical protein